MRKFLSLYPYSESIHWPVDSAGLFKYLKPIDFWGSIWLWLFNQQKPENEVGKNVETGTRTTVPTPIIIVKYFCSLQKVSNPWPGRDLPFKIDFASVVYLAQKVIYMDSTFPTLEHLSLINYRNPLRLSIILFTSHSFISLFYPHFFQTPYLCGHPKFLCRLSDTLCLYL